VFVRSAGRAFAVPERSSVDVTSFCQGALAVNGARPPCFWLILFAVARERDQPESSHWGGLPEAGFNGRAQPTWV